MKDLDSSLEEARRKTEKLSKIRREMQTALILESAPSEEDKDAFDAYIMDWISENREKFSRGFDTLISENPNLLEDWKKDPDSIFKELKKILK